MARPVLSWIIIAGALGLIALSASVAAAEPQNSGQPAVSGVARAAAAKPKAPVSNGSYYIEFRVATIGTYGHSYVAYGRLDARGRPVGTRYTDLHPMGNYAVMAVGHVLPVPANTAWDPQVAALPVASSYRRKLTVAQYRALLAAIARERANGPPVWNAVGNNCNHYVGRLATAVGLRVPSGLLASYLFVPQLRAMNEAR